jgi:hypothetical protein
MILDKRYFERKMMKSKEVEDVLGGADSWKNVDKTEVNCREEKCDNREAYFRQVQIRSADEPMTTFYNAIVAEITLANFETVYKMCFRMARELSFASPKKGRAIIFAASCSNIFL